MSDLKDEAIKFTAIKFESDVRPFNLPPSEELMRWFLRTYEERLELEKELDYDG